MDKISLVIVSKSDTVDNLNMLHACIDSAILNTGTEIEIIILDNHLAKKQRGSLLFCTIIKQPKPFNYNACLNAGAKIATGNYLYFANSDLIFTEGSLDELVRAMKQHKAGSASAICPVAHAHTTRRQGAMLSYNAGTHFTGWGFMFTKATYEAIGGLRTNSPFYCADNETIEQLREAKIPHALILSAEIEHLGQRTQNQLDTKTHFEYCVESVEKYNKLYGKNIFNLNPENEQKQT